MVEQGTADLADALTLEERKLRLEREKFDLEKQRTEGKGFFNNKFGLAITAIVSVATVVVSGFQLLISEKESQARLKLEIEKNDHAVEKDRQEFQFNIARLLLERQSDIKTSDPRSVIYVRNVVIATLPSEMARDITGRMAENSDDPDIRKAWLQGLAAVQSKADAPALRKAWAETPYSSGDTPAVSPSSATVAPTISSSYILTRFPETRGHEDRLELLLSAAHEQGIETNLRLAAFLACIFENSKPSLTEMSETLDFSARRLLLAFPSEFSTAKDAGDVAHNPERIANIVYAHRLGNGAPETGDGWRYRGRGYMQIIGRGEYAEASKATGIDLVSDPDKLLDPSIAARQAAAYFVGRGLNAVADSGNITTVWRRLNGTGFVGIDEVVGYYNRLLDHSVTVTAR